MESRANYALIGLFTLGVILGGFLFVWWLSGGERGARRETVRIIFSGSVAGLSKGSGVLFNGLRVGELTDLYLMPQDPSRVVGTAEVDRTTPIRADTKARLEYQGLTGVAQVALVGGDPSSPPLTPPPGETFPVIIAERGGLQDIMETVRTVAQRADDVLLKVDQVVTANADSLGRTVQNVERFSQALSENAPGVERFLAQVGDAAERIGPLAAKLETLATNVDQLVTSVDRNRVSQIVENVDEFTQSLAGNRQALDQTFKDVASLAKRLNETAPKLDQTLTDISKVANAVDPTKIGRTIDNADKFAQALGNSSKDVEKAIAEARQITEKLNKSADRVDGVLKAAESFLGSGAGGADFKSTFAEVAEAARSIRKLADNLDKRTEEITAGINRFTGPGLREVETFAADGRRTLNDISRAVKSLEKNPQQLIFGGRPSIPEYSGRR